MNDLITSLIKSTGSMFDLYTRTHAYHVNVTGKTFSQDHSFLKELYEEFNDHFDSLAELVRINEGFIPVNVHSLVNLSTLPEANENNNRELNYRNLILCIDVIIASLEASRLAAQGQSATGTYIEIENIIVSLSKRKWMLVSSL